MSRDLFLSYFLSRMSVPPESLTYGVGFGCLFGGPRVLEDCAWFSQLGVLLRRAQSYSLRVIAGSQCCV